MPFKTRITDDLKDEYYKLVIDDISLDRSDRSEWDERRRRIYNAYRNRVKKKVRPWPGCSNSSIPLITRATDRMVIHIMQTIAPQGNFDGVMAVPISDEPLAQERAENVSAYLNYYFRNRMKIADPLERFSRNFVLFGNAFAKMWWKRVMLNTRRVERFNAFRVIEDPETGEPLSELIKPKEAIAEFFGNMEVLEIKSTGKDSWRYVVYDALEKREKIMNCAVMFDEEARENHIQIDSKELRINQPQFDNIDIDDIYFSQSGSCIRDSHHVAIRYEKTLSELIAGWKSGRWNQLTADDISDLEAAADHDEDTGDTALELMPRTRIDMGQETKREADKSEGVRTDRVVPFEVIEDFRRLDIDGDGEEEEVVIWIETRTKKVLRVAHVFEDYHAFERPIIHAPFIPISNRVMGLGIGEVLMPLVVEVNTVFNNRNDAASLSVSPGGFYRPQSGFEPQKFPWQPNTWLPVDNPQADVREYAALSNPADSINVEQFLLGLVEDLSISTFTFGGGSNRPNSPRTARGTLAAIQQDEIKLNYMLQRLMPALEDICHKTLELLRVNGPDHEEFRVLGSKDIKTMSREDLASRIDFVFDLDSVSANKEIRRQFASAALEGTLQLAMMPAESVPQGARILGKNFLKAMDVKEADQILPDPAGFERPPMDPISEIHMMAQGVEIMPIQQDDHPSHIISMDQFEASEDFGSFPVEWVKRVWKPHKEAHVRMYQQMQQQLQAQTRGINTTGSQGNFQNPAAPNSVDLGNLAGGSELAAEALGSTFSGGQ